jgi:hypothetical protein
MSLLFSLVDVMSEVIGGSRVVVICGVVYVLAMSLIVGVMCGLEFGIVGEEESVPGAVLLLLRVLLVAEGLIVGLEHRALGHVQALLGDHGGEGAEVGSRVPSILHLVAA